MAKLSTHVLDTMHGKPAAGMTIIFRKQGEDFRWITLVNTVTNQDGRTDGQLLSGERIETGSYSIEFAVEDYFKRLGVPDAGKFLCIVPINFLIDDPTGNYHVPLLVSPWSYSTYRGS